MRTIATMRHWLSVLVLAALIAATGCGTLFAGGDQRLVFTSNPAGAQVLLDGFPLGTTPLNTMMARQTFQTHYITIRYPGFEPVQFPLQKTLTTASIFNLSSLSFWLTDATTGDVVEYSPSAYHVELLPARGMPGFPPAAPGVAPPMGVPPAVPTTWRRDHDPALWFVLVNEDALRTDISRGGGEYLRALAQQWQLDEHAMAAALQRDGHALFSAEFAYNFYLELRRVLDV